jgi:hypothetical protein
MNGVSTLVLLGEVGAVATHTRRHNVPTLSVFFLCIPLILRALTYL